MNTFKTILIWFFAFFITVGAAVFQRMTGPTHPLKEKVVLGQNDYRLKFTRSLETDKESAIELPIRDEKITGTVSYKIYPTNDAFTTDTLQRTEKGLKAFLPKQKAAGKVEYRIELTDGQNSYQSPYMIIRYKDPVPNVWLIMHIIAMFAAMYLAVVAGLMAVTKHGKYVRLFFSSAILLFIGGMVLGPVVQKFAFGEFWTGVPFGWDLTDNKTLIVILASAFACYKNYKEPSRLWTIIAVLVLLVVYSIPHSLFGSELNPETGEITQATFGQIGLLLGGLCSKKREIR